MMISARHDLYQHVRFPACMVLVLGACSQSATLDERSRAMPSGEVSIGDVLERDELAVRVLTMEELIASRFPGVVIRRSGSQTWLEVRGPGSISAGTEALIIIDGIQSSSRGFLAMNPDDIQRIEVLKAASAAIYGVRAANGVLVVTTRRMEQ